MIELGKTYRDKITGFEGVATGCVTYLTGCNQVLLAPRVGEDGTMRDSAWLDEQRLEETNHPQIKLDNTKGNGFDKPAPRR
jgi:hypothetical protein